MKTVENGGGSMTVVVFTITKINNLLVGLFNKWCGPCCFDICNFKFLAALLALIWPFREKGLRLYTGHTPYCNRCL